MQYISLVVKPHAKVTAWTGAYTDLMGRQVFTCSLNAPAHDGAANAELISLVANSLHIPKDWIRLVKGNAGRHKVIAIASQAPEFDFISLLRP